jgi:hypothetical protein
MSAIDFKILARLTAQSLGSDPKLPPGGIPEFTAEDVRATLGKAQPQVAFHCVMAKHCEDEYSEDWLIRYSHMKSRAAWHEAAANKRRLICTQQLDLVGELALLYHLVPYQASKRSEANNAKWCQVARNTYRAKYEQHRRALTTFLDDMELQAIGKMKRYLYGR